MKFRDETQQVGRKVREKASRSRGKQLPAKLESPAQLHSSVSVEGNDSTSLASESMSEGGASLPDVGGGEGPSTSNQQPTIMLARVSTPRLTL